MDQPNDCRRTFILDGYPRSVYERRELTRSLGARATTIDTVLILYVCEDELLRASAEPAPRHRWVSSNQLRVTRSDQRRAGDYYSPNGQRRRAGAIDSLLRGAPSRSR